MSKTDVRAPKQAIAFRLNGQETTLDARAGQRLLDVLREEGHLKGAKEGCGEGECGACTVLLDSQAVCACLVLAQTVEGQSITTIEGLGKADKMHPVQRHVVEEMGTQCGFCTPGVILSAAQLLDDNPSATRSEILEGISGTLCRCTGYNRIVAAVEAARDEMSE